MRERRVKRALRLLMVKIGRLLIKDDLEILAVVQEVLLKMLTGMPPLIPRAVLLGNPKRSQPELSPDGMRIAYLAPNESDALQIWVRTLGKSDDRCVSAERRSIQNYEWACDSKTIFYREDNEGDENFHIYAIDLETPNARDLTPWQGVRCQNTMTSAKRPGEILALLNVRDRKLMDVWRIDLRTGAANARSGKSRGR